MKFLYLRKIRKIVSVIFLLLIAIVFLDITTILPSKIINYVTYLQFIPSTINFFNLLIPAFAGFIIVLILTLLFGRIYCSSICPLGTLQDLSSRLAIKINKKKKFAFTKEYFWLRYSVFVLVILSIMSGSLFLVNIIDPYSNTGRIFAQLFNPLLVLINNFAAFTLEKFNIYLIYPIEVKAFYLIAALFPLLFLMIVMYLAYKRGRLYCNTVCPVGTLLGLISKFTFFKLKIDKSSCEGCGLCERVCKAECIEKVTKEIDFSRCVVCFNCTNVCPSDSINFRFTSISNHQLKTSESRRNFLSRTSKLFVVLSSSALSQIKIIPKKQSKVEVSKKYYVSPPGSRTIDHFNNNCTACYLCITTCPTKVLQPSLTEYGVLNIFQPFMDYKTSFCNYDCVVCSQVCPTSAIFTITPEQKKNIQVGKANFIKENCIVETENTACGACSEHCPTKAVMMVDYKGNLKIPEVTNKYCVGCGACEYACPTTPYKAIYVEGNSIHQTAEKKPTEKLDQDIDYKEEFPF